MNQNFCKTDKMTRLEVIEVGEGRKYVRWDCKFRIDIQDEGRTMKIFVSGRDDANGK